MPPVLPRVLIANHHQATKIPREPTPATVVQPSGIRLFFGDLEICRFEILIFLLILSPNRPQGMNILRSMKRILVGGLATALVILSVHALGSDKLAALRAKAEAGDGPSQYELGLAYADPQEPMANIIEAYVWFTLASENGAPGKAYMIVTSQMSSQQLIDGKKLLEQRRGDLAAHRPISTVVPVVRAADPVSPVSPVMAASAEPDNTAIKA